MRGGALQPAAGAARAADSHFVLGSSPPVANTSFLCGEVGTPTAFFHLPFDGVMKCASCDGEGILKGICVCVCRGGRVRLKGCQRNRPSPLCHGRNKGEEGGRRTDRQINSRPAVERNTPTGSDWGGVTDEEAPLNYVTEMVLFVLLLAQTVTRYVLPVKQGCLEARQ